MPETTKKRGPQAQIWYGLRDGHNCDLVKLIPDRVWDSLDEQDCIVENDIKFRSFFSEGRVVGFGILLSECETGEPKGLGPTALENVTEQLASRVRATFDQWGMLADLEHAHVRIGTWHSIDDRR